MQQEKAVDPPTSDVTHTCRAAPAVQLCTHLHACHTPKALIQDIMINLMWLGLHV